MITIKNHYQSSLEGGKGGREERSLERVPTPTKTGKARRKKTGGSETGGTSINPFGAKKLEELRTKQTMTSQMAETGLTAKTVDACAESWKGSYFNSKRLSIGMHHHEIQTEERSTHS